MRIVLACLAGVLLGCSIQMMIFHQELLAKLNLIQTLLALNLGACLTFAWARHGAEKKGSPRIDWEIVGCFVK